jgi:GNAT superfamily N-acetyltransferase
MAQEMWWWLTPSARGTNAGKRMFEQIEAWATEHNVNATFMVALADNRVEKMTKLYERAGYEPMERTFVKGSKTWQ